MSTGSPRILFLALECETWRMGRQWSYGAQLGIEEGFAGAGVRWLTITTPCWKRAADLVGRRRFDQVWLHVVHAPFAPDAYRWVAGLAPVRVGMLFESLDYTPEEHQLIPHLHDPRNEFERWRPHLTHVVAVDEAVVGQVVGDGDLPAMWWPSAVPARTLRGLPTCEPKPVGYFSGTGYGERAGWFEQRELKDLLAQQTSSEAGTPIPALFDAVQTNVQRYLCRRWLPGAAVIHEGYLAALRTLRRAAFDRWLRSLREGAAVVSLPSLCKCYPSRVVEGLAAGRPVVAGLVENRPRNLDLFRDGEEILLFRRGDPAGLAAQLRRVLDDPAWAARIAARGYELVRRHHTLEHRLRQVLNWIATGEAPRFRET